MKDRISPFEKKSHSQDHMMNNKILKASIIETNQDIL
jgi:hypothetical protein